MGKIKLLDCTLRDGSNAVNFQHTKKDTEIIAHMLDESGIDFIEIGHGYGIGANDKLKNAAASDEEYMQAGHQKIKKAKWGMFFQPKFGNSENLKLGKNYGMDFIRIGTNPEDIKDSYRWISEAKKMNYIVFYSIMKGYSISPERFADIAISLYKKGVDCVYFMDSAGMLIPNDVKRYILSVNNISKIPIGFHGHNNLGLAIANSLTALECGVKFIDLSIGGLGRSAGNAQTEIFVMLLRKFGYHKEYNFEKLCELNRKFIAPKSPNISSISEKEIIFGYAGFHSSFEPIVDEVLIKFPTINKNDLICEICEYSRTSLTAKVVENIAGSLAKRTK